MATISNSNQPKWQTYEEYLKTATPPKHPDEHPFNQEAIQDYLSKLYDNPDDQDYGRERTYIAEILKITKYVSFNEFKDNLIILKNTFNHKFNDNDYIACIFDEKGNSIRHKSNYWVFQLFMELGLNRPLYVVENGQALPELFAQGHYNFVFFDDASYTGWQLYNIIYRYFGDSVFNNRHMSRKYMINIYVLVPYVTSISLMLLETSMNRSEFLGAGSIELQQKRDKENVYKVDPYKRDVIRRFCKLGIFNTQIIVELGNLYSREHDEIKAVRDFTPFYKNITSDLFSDENKKLVQLYELRPDQIPVYFAHKLPDSLSVPLQVYLGIIPVIKENNIRLQGGVVNLITGCTHLENISNTDRIAYQYLIPPYVMGSLP